MSDPYVRRLEARVEELEAKCNEQGEMLKTFKMEWAKRHMAERERDEAIDRAEKAEARIAKLEAGDAGEGDDEA